MTEKHYCKDCKYWQGDWVKDLLKECVVERKDELLVDGHIFATAPFYSCNKFMKRDK